MTFGRRLEKIETSLTPQQAVLSWLQERRDVGAEKYIEESLLDPLSARTRVSTAVTDALRENLGKMSISSARISRAMHEAVEQVDMLMVLIAVLEDKVRSECSLNPVYVELFLEKLRRMLLDYKSVAPYDTQALDLWRARFIARRRRMRLLKEAVESISVRYYDGHPLIFVEDANKLNQTTSMLEEVLTLYNTFQNGVSELRPITSDAISNAADVESLVEYFEVEAKALSLSGLGDATSARRLTNTYLSRVSRQLKDSDPSLSLYDYLTT